MFPSGFQFRLGPAAFLRSVSRKPDFTAFAVQLVKRGAALADVAAVRPAELVEVVPADKLAGFVNQTVRSVADWSFSRTNPQSTAGLNWHQAIRKMRRGYSTASAVDIIADNIHVFVEQHKCRNIILLGRLLYCSRQRTFRIDTDEETVIACHAEIGAFDRCLNRCNRSARIGIIERRSLVFITSQQKSAV